MSERQDLIVIGGGEHARVVLEAALSRPDRFRLLGFVDPQPCEETCRRLDVRRLGDDAQALARAREGAVFVVGVGAVGLSSVRRSVVAPYAAAGARFVAVVHGRAWVSPTAVVEPGAFVSAGALVNSGAHIGAHAVVNTGAVIEHDVVLGDFAQAGPGCAIGGGARIGADAYLGLGSRVRDHVSVGDRALVAMGAVVVRPVAEGAQVRGVPAREAEAC